MEVLTQTKPYFFFDQLFDKTVLNALKNEAKQQQTLAKQNTLTENQVKERGGKPRRKLKTASGEVMQDKIYHSEKLIAFFEQHTGLKITPTGNRGSYSYYHEEGDWLDIHRDIRTCDLTLITCLESNIPEDSSSGLLYLYTQRQEDSIFDIYKDRMRGYQSICLKPGQSILIRGGLIPHGVNPIEKGHYRTISALCYEAI